MKAGMRWSASLHTPLRSTHLVTVRTTGNGRRNRCYFTGRLFRGDISPGRLPSLLSSLVWSSGRFLMVQGTDSNFRRGCMAPLDHCPLKYRSALLRQGFFPIFFSFFLNYTHFLLAVIVIIFSLITHIYFFLFPIYSPIGSPIFLISSQPPRKGL